MTGFYGIRPSIGWSDNQEFFDGEKSVLMIGGHVCLGGPPDMLRLRVVKPMHVEPTLRREADVLSRGGQCVSGWEGACVCVCTHVCMCA